VKAVTVDWAEPEVKTSGDHVSFLWHRRLTAQVENSMEEKQEGPHETDDVKTDNTSNSVDVSIKTKQKQTKNPPETDGIPVENR